MRKVNISGENLGGGGGNGGIYPFPPPLPVFEGRGVLYNYFIFGLTNPISFSD